MKRQLQLTFFAWAAFLILAAAPPFALAQTGAILNQGLYLNRLYEGTPTNQFQTQSASVALFSGETGEIPGAPVSADGQVCLTQCAIGQPVGAVPFALPTGTSIVAQPQNQTANPGGSGTFAVSATGPAPLSYQWQFDGTPISGATGSTLTLTNVQAANAGTYSVVVTSAAGSLTSAGATLTVNGPPAITGPPQSLAVNPGASATFNVTASGTAPLDYQWSFNGVPIGGATASTYTLTNAQPANAGTYSVVVTNVAGSATSVGATLAINVPPTVGLTSPTNGQFLAYGSPLILAATATNYPAMVTNVQFLVAGQVIGNSTAPLPGTSTYLITATNAPAGTDLVSAVATDNNGLSATSAPVTVIVHTLPTVSITSPANGAVYPPPLANVEIIASGNSPYGPVTVQIFLQGSLVGPSPQTLVGLTTGSYAISAVATDPAGLTATNSILIFVGAVPSVSIISPTNGAVFTGSATGLAINANATDPNPGDTITNVLFFTDTTNELGAGTNSGNGSFFFTWTNATTGIYVLTAQAFDSLGLSSVSAPVSITVATLSVAISSPAAGMIFAAPATFTISATVSDANATVTHVQFLINGLVIGNATTAPFSTTASNLAAGSYTLSAVAADSNGLTATNSIPVTVDAPPTINVQPRSQTASQGTNVTFSVTAGGTAPFSYQWSFDGAIISGATASTYTLTNVQPASAGTYSVVVTNVVGSATSTGATLTVNVAPTIIVQPRSLAVNPGASASFTVTASGTAPLSYQWYFDGAPISGATASTFTTNNVQAGSAGTYSVVVTNAAASVTSTGATLTVNAPPTITGPPQSLAANQGTSASFTVTASGTPPLSYQWSFDGAAISGATASTLTLTNVQPANAGTYSVVVTNVAGSATSAGATLKVNIAPTITGQPPSVAVNPGASASFTVTASGTAPLSYQWYFDGATVSGATASALTVTNVQPANAGTYDVVVTNAAGSVTSTGATLTVNTAPTITRQPQSLAVNPGANASFNVTASGTAPLSYQWSFNGATISGATFSTLTLTNVQSANTGTYNVVVSNVAGSVTSTGATLSLNVAPTVRLTSPTNGQFLAAGSPFLITATATGSSAMVTNVQFLVGSTVISNSTSPPYSATTNIASPGSYTLFAIATDTDGLTGTNSIQVTVATPPTVNITAPANGAVYPPTTTAITIIASGHSPYGPVTVVIYLNGGLYGPSPQTLFGPTTGPYLISAVATDPNGLTATNSILIFVGTVPSVSIISPTNGAMFTGPATSIAINANATDPNPGYTITNVQFFAGTTNELGAGTNGPGNAFSFTWTNATTGTYVLTAEAFDSLGLTNISAPVTITVSAPPTNPAVFMLSTNAYWVTNNPLNVVTQYITVLKNANSVAATVNFTTQDGSAHLVSPGGVGSYFQTNGNLALAAAQTSATVPIRISPIPIYLTNTAFSFQLSPSGDGSTVGSPRNAVITIVNTNAPFSSNSVLNQPLPASPPILGSLEVTLTYVTSGGQPTNSPAGVAGQWQFVWESAWHNSGDSVSGLPPGTNYYVQFSPVAGFVTPPNITNSVPAGQNVATNCNYVSSGGPGNGWLGVTNNPATGFSFAGGLWQLQGDPNNTWHTSGDVTNLLVGNYTVLFTNVTGWFTPSNQTAPVVAGQTSTIGATYYPNTGQTPPTALNFSKRVTIAPFAYNGQLFTDAGYGSGCLVQSNVVLTAGHVVFNDFTFSNAQEILWFFQESAGSYQPPPQVAAGSYILSGYAAARSNDLSNGLSSGQESVASYDRDVAALFFLLDAGRGGASSGYLVSDATNNYLTTPNAENQILVGYPVAGLGPITNGVMYETLNANGINFTQLSSPYNVYGTADIAGYPGNSGGPLLVQLEGNPNYYPAGVYLGQNGKSQAVVRMIDSEVAGLIYDASLSAYTGAIYSGNGGAIPTQGNPGAPLQQGDYQIVLKPPLAVTNGAGWKIQGVNSNFTNSAAVLPLIAGTYTVVFANAAGFRTPSNQNLTILANQTASITVTYAVIAATIKNFSLSGTNLILSGTGGLANGTYYLLTSTNVALPLSRWTAVATNAFNSSGDFSITNRYSAANQAQFFIIASP